ncbi:hypothetical protein [Rhizobium sp. Root651]|uniref:hypothetical protein n=1 Tax=Rhizobium sp. Root651 TaxID=1736577 RepID=UPI000713E40E|nr:hypothetical protein [Rhizobium sp. Root651]KRA58209.1 hypothetical protein ASD85_17170 [Rhizobium sp. Root651]
MVEQRYKVGGWVRVKDNRGAPLDYKVGDVCQVSTVRDDLVFSNKKPGMLAKRFEPWQPRIGERVRFTDNVPSFWFFGPAKEYKDGVIKSLNSEGYRFCVKTGDAVGHVNIEHIEPITTATTPEQPATLKIEAGKFYKTRDGRKVGPMERREGYLSHEDWHYNASGECCYRGRSGDCVQKDREIIAEWIDEPVAKPSNDNAQPKFKVGDRISGYAPAWGNVTGVITALDTSSPTQTYLIKDDKSAHTMWIDNYSIITPPTPTTAIVALIENGQPKPSSTPHVHTSEVAAHKEAGRLAAKHKGQQFGVFTLTATHREERVYEHKWQSMAALGLKVDAIRELQAVAGLDRVSAKRAVEAFAA